MAIFDKTWWLEHGSTYKTEMAEGKHGPAEAYKAQELALIEVLSKLRFDSVFEIGCGYGRITRLISQAFKPKRYVATDVSEDALQVMEEYLADEKLYVSRVRVDLDDWDPYIEHEKYNLVIASEVLMHRTPKQVQKDLDKMFYISNNYVVLVDWYEPGFRGQAQGCYMHKWTGLADEYPVPEFRQSIWVFK